MMRPCIYKQISALTAALACGLLLSIPSIARAENWALLIGIDKYEDVNRITDLTAATADATAMAKTLKEVCGFSEDHIELLVSDGNIKPTRVNILTGLARLVKNAKPSDTVFVLYSGHGVEIDGDPYLLPYDTGALEEGLLAQTALPASTFRQYLSRVHAKALVLAFDMCRSEPKRSGKDIATPDNTLSLSVAKSLNLKVSSPQSEAGKAGGSPVATTTIELLSCSKDERSYEWHDKGRGYFSYFLEQGLRGKAADKEGNVTAGILVQYVHDQVTTNVQRIEQKTQTPLPLLDGNDAESFVLSRAEWRLTGVPRPIPTKAQLDVLVNVPKAELAVDGEYMSGNTYVTNLLDQTEKTVTIEVSAPGYETVTMKVTLHRGKTEPLSITLNSSPSSVPTVAPKKIEPPLRPAFFIQEARNIADGMTSANRSVAYSKITLAQRAGGDTEGARQSASEVSKSVSIALNDLEQWDARGGNGKAMSLVALAQAQATIGEVNEAQSTIAKAKEEAPRVSSGGSRVGVVNEIAIAQFLNGDMAGAQASIREAKQLTMRGSGSGLASCLSGIARTQVILGDIAGARKTITRARIEVGKTQDPVVNALPLSHIAEAQAACGDIDEARETTEKIVNIYRKSEALGAISKAQAMKGDTAGALATAALIVGDNRKAEALVEIAKKQAAKGDITGARDTAASIIVAYWKANAFAEIAKVMAETKNK